MLETYTATLIKQIFQLPPADFSAEAYGRLLKKDLVESFSNIFKHINPNFDVASFMETCND